MSNVRLRRLAPILGVIFIIGAALGAGCSDDDDKDTTPTTAATAAATNAATSAPPTAGPGGGGELTDMPMSADDVAEVDRAVEAQVEGGFGPGVHVGIWDPEKGFVVKAYGEAIQGSTPATASDTVLIGSITKTFTSTVILSLIDDGEFALEDTVADAAPGVAGKHPEIGDITVEQLLGMASGISDYLGDPNGVVSQLSEDPASEFDTDELIASGIALGVTPGETGYSNTNYLILQEVAEEVGGKSLADLIAERATEPLGLDDTRLLEAGTDTLPTPFTHGYVNEDCAAEVSQLGGTAAAGDDMTDWNVASYAQGAGAVYSTLNDMGRWGASTLGNSLLSDELAAARIAPGGTDLGGGRTYGLGIFRIGDWLGHSGEVIGWEALILHNPKTSVTMAFAVNSCSGGEITFRYIADSLYPDTGLLD